MLFYTFQERYKLEQKFVDLVNFIKLISWVIITPWSYKNAKKFFNMKLKCVCIGIFHINQISYTFRLWSREFLKVPWTVTTAQQDSHHSLWTPCYRAASGDGCRPQVPRRTPRLTTRPSSWPTRPGNSWASSWRDAEIS